MGKLEQEPLLCRFCADVIDSCRIRTPIWRSRQASNSIVELLDLTNIISLVWQTYKNK